MTRRAQVHGVSTRSVDDLVKAMGAVGMSKSQVSRLCIEIDERVNAFFCRPLEGAWPYLRLDATYLKVPESGRIVSRATRDAAFTGCETRWHMRQPSSAPRGAILNWTSGRCLSPWRPATFERKTGEKVHHRLMARRISAILSLDVVGFTARMSENPTATLRDLQRVLDRFVRPAVRDHDGRIFKLMGDGALAEFQSAAGAITATHEILQRLRGDPVVLRAGVHVGDVVVKDGDVFGEAVNMAARLQTLAEPGGALISKTAAEVAETSASISLKPESALRLKGFPVPVEAYSIDLDGKQRQAGLARMAASQEIRFARSRDGTSLAWTSTGHGKTLVKAPHWVQHLEHEWTHDPLDGWLPLLSDRYRLIRFDTRNNGLSERGVQDIGLERMLEDLEAVLDAADIRQAPMFGLSFGAVVAAAFAARRPDRVSKLVLMGGFVQGLVKRNRPADAALGKAIMQMSKAGWNDDYPSARDLMAQSFAPTASPQDQRAYAEYMKLAMDLEDWLKVGDVVDNVDITELLPQITCPALVLQASRERMHSPDQGRRLAGGIRQSRFVVLDTFNNTMPAYDRMWPKALSEIDAFLRD